MRKDEESKWEEDWKRKFGDCKNLQDVIKASCKITYSVEGYKVLKGNREQLIRWRCQT